MSTYDTVCLDCAGTQIDKEGDPCEHCEGYGHLLTDEGEQLVAFLERHGFTRSMSLRTEVDLANMLEK